MNRRDVDDLILIGIVLAIGVVTSIVAVLA